MACEHLNFDAHVQVGRINQTPDGPIVAYLADISVRCRDCGQPFVFIGVPTGCSFYRPAVSLSGEQIHVPLAVPGTHPPPGLASYTVSQQIFDPETATKQ